jgi:hypothetical protein
MHLTEIGWEGVDLIHMSQGRDQWRALENTDELLGSIKRKISPLAE